MRQSLKTTCAAVACALASIGALNPNAASTASIDLTSMVLNGAAQLNGSDITLATGNGQAGSAWTPATYALTATTNFQASFTYIGTGLADGMTFTIQNSSTSALGGAGSGLGYDTEVVPGVFTNNIPNSLAVGLDYYANFIWSTPTNTVLGINGTGLLSAGHLGLGLATGNPINVVINYDSATHTLTAYLDNLLWLTIVDDIFSDVGNAAYFGFTAATGEGAATSVVISFVLVLTDTNQATPLPAALPLFGSVLGAAALAAWRRKRVAARHA